MPQQEHNELLERLERVEKIALRVESLLLQLVASLAEEEPQTSEPVLSFDGEPIGRERAEFEPL